MPDMARSVAGVRDLLVRRLAGWYVVDKRDLASSLFSERGLIWPVDEKQGGFLLPVSPALLWEGDPFELALCEQKQLAPRLRWVVAVLWRVWLIQGRPLYEHPRQRNYHPDAVAVTFALAACPPARIRWLLDYGYALANTLQVERGQHHRCHDYLDFFNGER